MVCKNKTTVENFEKNLENINEEVMITDIDFPFPGFTTREFSGKEYEIEIESLERSDRNSIKNKRKNRYDLGICFNLIEVFGQNPFLWFIPICNKNYKKQGYNFENYKGKGKTQETLKNNLNQLRENTHSTGLIPDYKMEKDLYYDKE